MGAPAGAAADDEAWMARALALAGRARGLTSPNPMVGALVVRDGVCVGEGFHRRAGAAHAEVEALGAAGERARGATLYVTLEPCNHAGRTPPCTPAVLSSGVARVVIATNDPNPRVPGGGADILRAAGLAVTVGCLAAEARAVNEPFFTAMLCRRPHVTLKCAMTLDGKIAGADGRARWITGPAARREAHRMRAQSDAVVVGIGTALVDDPALDVRLDAPWPREPLRVVVDSFARLPANARLIGAGDPARAVIAVTEAAPAERVAALVARGATLLRCRARDGRVDVVDLLAHLLAADVIAVLLEGGAVLNGAFVDAGVVDRAAFFVAPIILGGSTAPGAVAGLGRTLPDAFRLEALAARPVGPDWLLEGAVDRSGGSV
ncbi:MAG TPA: bifunctional diaminohydroxyphosphoribosylaminopyrimidine deaminase/5-amino-6-(5-phosphoribosylamino)uracil reductase RibD [Candidatus Binatia bacterium]|nr:bifunctional diaminohydroxyphosphoribosylaminopyrimidine deaminase/5-amino-6-(5-phosphoribosylamino)uracil reductase RibD [Candidatus Binatia bacterium]